MLCERVESFQGNDFIDKLLSYAHDMNNMNYGLTQYEEMNEWLLFTKLNLSLINFDLHCACVPCLMTRCQLMAIINESTCALLSILQVFVYHNCKCYHSFVNVKHYRPCSGK